MTAPTWGLKESTSASSALFYYTLPTYLPSSVPLDPHLLFTLAVDILKAVLRRVSHIPRAVLSLSRSKTQSRSPIRSSIHKFFLASPATHQSTNMAQDNLTGGLKDLQTPDQILLFDEIDKLRSLGIDHEVQLPQLIVCGDTSAGKSSVLEAISTVPFPSADNVCTRFATQISLRSSPDAHAAVKIRASRSASTERQRILGQFVKTGCKLSEVPSLVEEAAEVMGLDKSEGFSDDVLELQLCGPKLPSLTLVDLPGFIQTPNGIEEPDHVERVNSLVESYMEDSRSVILAVIAANNHIYNQSVLRKAQKHDPQGFRTMGIITKPDLLEGASGMRTEYLSLARNDRDKYRLDLGWHVLRNAGCDERESKKFDRDSAEAVFFSKDPWKDSLREDAKGIQALRKRLSTILFNQICTELPGLVSELKEKQEDCRKKVAQLKEPRDTVGKQKKFLQGIVNQFSRRTNKAINGVYDSAAALESSSTVDAKRLRAIVRMHSSQFADTMRLQGRTCEVIEDDLSKEDVARQYNFPAESLSPHFPPPQFIIRSEFIQTKVLRTLRDSQGCELPGTFNPLLVCDIFQYLSKPWEDIARFYAEDVWCSVKEFLSVTLSEIADPEVEVNLQEHIFEDAINLKKEEVDRKISELLIPFKQSYPATMNTIFKIKLDGLRDYRAKHTTSATPTKAVPSAWESEVCLDLLDCTHAYYDVAREIFIDNVISLAVENCLIGNLENLLTTEAVEDMTPERIAQLVAESEETAKDRKFYKGKLELLDASLEICKRHEKRLPRAHRIPLSADYAKTPGKVDVSVDNDSSERGQSPSHWTAHARRDGDLAGVPTGTAAIHTPNKRANGSGATASGTPSKHPGNSLEVKQPSSSRRTASPSYSTSSGAGMFASSNSEVATTPTSGKSRNRSRSGQTPVSAITDSSNRKKQGTYSDDEI